MLSCSWSDPLHCSHRPLPGEQPPLVQCSRRPVPGCRAGEHREAGAKGGRTGRARWGLGEAASSSASEAQADPGRQSLSLFSACKVTTTTAVLCSLGCGKLPRKRQKWTSKLTPPVSSNRTVGLCCYINHHRVADLLPQHSSQTIMGWGDHRPKVTQPTVVRLSPCCP